MLKISNMGPIEFKKYIHEKKIYIWGAGRALESCIDIYCRENEIKGIIDNNKTLWGTVYSYNNQEVLIKSPEAFFEEIQDKALFKDCVLMISSPFYAADIVEELDNIPQLDGLECFLQVLIRNTKESVERFEFTQGENKIPKKIHYIWVGNKPLPDKYEKNIDSWKKYNPDFEIIRWDESNYDFTTCDYVREAFCAKEWSFVSNYARLDIVYQHGGIYLDTDVEVIHNLEVLLKDEVFLNMGCADRINMGCGFGAIAGHSMIDDMKKRFENSHFWLKEKAEKKPFHTFVHPITEKYGFKIENRYQKKSGIALYPCEVMSPLTIGEMSDFFSEKTVSIHHEEGNWKTDNEKRGLEKLNGLIAGGRICQK